MNEENTQVQVRKDKLEKIKELGFNPYPYKFEPSHSVPELKSKQEALLALEETVSVAGRMMAIRGKGKAMFAQISDKHERIQIYIRKDVVGEDLYSLIGLCDMGDFLGISGTMMVTKTGELTVRVSSFQLLSKALRPLPVTKEKEVDGEKVRFDEISDKELKYRQRYVDLALNADVASVFRSRSLIIQTIRQYLIDASYLEVETPTLQSVYGGANATPFKTHHNALGEDFFLRISNELFLKRLVGGGYDRVFEFVKNFRNEGIDRTHNPEFTGLEFYEAYADYGDMMTHCEKIWEACALAIHGTTEFEYQGTMIDVKAPWKRISMLDAIESIGNIPFSTMDDDQVKQLLKDKGWELDGEFSRGRAMQMVFEESCEESLIQPTFITDHPRESTPLCKAHRDNPELVERFEAYINQWELANAYSELNDPVKQRDCLVEQTERGRGGEAETHPYDQDYVRAMEYGMPPMGGIGFGIDRMVMLLTNQSTIRDVILFPTMRPE